MHAAFQEYLASTAVGGLALAYGLALFVVSQTRGDRAMGLAWVSGGATATVAPHLAGPVDPADVGAAERLFPLLVAGVFVGVWAYLLHLINTSHGSAQARRRMRGAVHVGVSVAAVMTVLAVLRPEPFLDDFVLSLDGSTPPGGDFWQFGVPLLLSSSGYAVAWVGLARQDIDPGERARAVAHALAVLPLTLSLVLTLPSAILTFALASAISIYGMMGHLTAQGARAAFLSRFLSPQVAEQVRADGLQAVMRPDDLTVTVVACDLRGFTAYAEGVPSHAVIDLLGEYYQTVGAAVAEVDGTVKDYAGDGILVLIGAPLPHPDHASAGLALARRIHELTRPLLSRWATGPHPLGIGVGVATGRVTVGIIGSDARVEYTAVGTPVNLAARLCSAAAAGEILVDAATAAAADEADVEPREDVVLKGLSRHAAAHAYRP